MNDFLERIYWGNSVLDYLIAAGSILVVWVILKLIKNKLIFFLKKLSAKTETSFDDIIIKAFEKFVLPFVYLMINYMIIKQLNLSEKFHEVLKVAILFVTTFYAIRLVNFLIHGAVILYMERKNEPPERIKQLNGILIVLKIITWGLGLLMLIDNLGYDITAIIAGLGVGGIAIALAAQNILGDLFSYLVIFFDKPFEIGDFIIVGDNKGNVERIGIKTSHVRSIDGEQLVMPNAMLVSTVIHNFKRLQRRRIVFTIGVVYYTPAEKLKKIPDIVRKVIDDQKDATFDRTHLSSFGDFSVNFEIVYYVESPEYLVYMDVHHAISISIFEKFETEKIEFAFPTQTLFVTKQELENKSG